MSDVELTPDILKTISHRMSFKQDNPIEGRTMRILEKQKEQESNRMVIKVPTENIKHHD